MTQLYKLKQLIYSTDSIESLSLHIPMEFYSSVRYHLKNLKTECKKFIPEIIDTTVLYKNQHYIISEIDDADFYVLIKNKETGNIDVVDILNVEQP